MSLKARKRERAYKKIVRQIQQSIQEGSLAPGDQLMPERQLAETLGVSRSSIREALTALSSMGLIEVKPGGGAYIREFNLESIVEPLKGALLKNNEDVIFLLETRKILEVQAVKLAAVRGTKRDLFHIKEEAVKVKLDIQEGVYADEADTNFHYRVVEATHNPILINFMLMITGMMKEVYGPMRRELLADNSLAPKYSQQHFAIISALEGLDGTLASQLMLEHLEMAEKQARGIMGEVVDLES